MNLMAFKIFVNSLPRYSYNFLLLITMKNLYPIILSATQLTIGSSTQHAFAQKPKCPTTLK